MSGETLKTTVADIMSRLIGWEGRRRRRGKIPQDCQD